MYRCAVVKLSGTADSYGSIAFNAPGRNATDDIRLSNCRFTGAIFLVSQYDSVLGDTASLSGRQDVPIFFTT